MASLPANDISVSMLTPHCSICLDEEKLACCAWSGCGHRLACLECARRLCSQLDGCPLCRAQGRPIAIRD